MPFIKSLSISLDNRQKIGQRCHLLQEIKLENLPHLLHYHWVISLDLFALLKRGKEQGRTWDRQRFPLAGSSSWMELVWVASWDLTWFKLPLDLTKMSLNLLCVWLVGGVTILLDDLTRVMGSGCRIHVYSFGQETAKRDITVRRSATRRGDGQGVEDPGTCANHSVPGMDCCHTLPSCLNLLKIYINNFQVSSILSKSAVDKLMGLIWSYQRNKLPCQP